MPSNQAPLGALPSRFRRQRVLIVGCGDVGLRVLQQQRHVRFLALTSDPQRVSALRAAGATPLLGNLDKPHTLQRLAGLATRVLHLAPPPLQGSKDPRTLALCRVLSKRTAVQSVVYASTSGVYGDCAGDWVHEHRSVNPTTPRAQRRVDAEQRVRWMARLRHNAVRVSVLRVPGIYASDREGGTPRERLLRGTPVLLAQDDVFTNHIHANDLARACQRALWRGKTQRCYNISDDSQLKMGDYYDAAAQLYGLEKPRRVSRPQAQSELPPMQWSFMGESRRLVNQRMKQELGLRLQHADVLTGLAHADAHIAKNTLRLAR